MYVGKVGFVGSEITDTSLESLQGLSRLQEVRLYAPNVTDMGLEYLRGLPQLKKLTLGKTKVTAKGLRKLALALPNCKIEH
jgi:hypothetical protein